MSRFKFAGLSCLFMMLSALSVAADQIDDLLTDLAGGDTHKQILAVMTLKRVRDPRITQAVIIRATDGDTPLSVRRACVEIIGGQRLTEGLGALLAIATDVQQPFAIREPAILGLVNVSGATHADVLVKLVREDESTLVRQTASIALGNTGDKRVTLKVTELLNDPKTAHYGVTALAALGDKAAVPSLISKLKTENLTLRNAIIKTLGDLGDPRSTEALMALLGEKNEYQKLVIIGALGKLNTPAVVSKLAALASDRTASENVRTRALLSIADLKATTALPTVATVARSPNENVVLRLDAVRTLGSLGDVSIPTLIVLLDEKALANAAALSLSNITGAYFGPDRARWTRYYTEYKRQRERARP